jgi:hypothetical protein
VSAPAHSVPQPDTPGLPRALKPPRTPSFSVRSTLAGYLRTKIRSNLSWLWMYHAVKKSLAGS